jgi:hypothetical protein
MKRGGVFKPCDVPSFINSKRNKLANQTSNRLVSTNFASMRILISLSYSPSLFSFSLISHSILSISLSFLFNLSIFSFTVFPTITSSLFVVIPLKPSHLSPFHIFRGNYIVYPNFKRKNLTYDSESSVQAHPP